MSMSLPQLHHTHARTTCARNGVEVDAMATTTADDQPASILLRLQVQRGLLTMQHCTTAEAAWLAQHLRTHTSLGVRLPQASITIELGADGAAALRATLQRLLRHIARRLMAQQAAAQQQAAA